MAPTPGSLSAFSHKTAVRVCFCARPLPFLKAFEERAECMGDARSVRAPTGVCALGIHRLPRPTPTAFHILGTHALCILHPPPHVLCTHHLARPAPTSSRAPHPHPRAPCTHASRIPYPPPHAPLAPTALHAPRPPCTSLAPTTSCTSHPLPPHPTPTASHALHRPSHSPGTDRGARLASPRSSHCLGPERENKLRQEKKWGWRPPRRCNCEKRQEGVAKVTRGSHSHSPPSSKARRGASIAWLGPRPPA